MSKTQYPPELRTQILADLDSTQDVKLVATSVGVTEHAIYWMRRECVVSPEIAKDKKIRELTNSRTRRTTRV
jgi:hypothetical protein